MTSVACALFVAFLSIAVAVGAPLAPPPTLAVVVTVTAIPLLLSALLAWRAPEHPAGMLLAVAGIAALVENCVRQDVLGPWGGTWVFLYLPFGLLLLVMPDGRARSARWRLVGWITTGLAVVFVGLVALDDVASDASAVVDVIAVPVLLAFGASLVVCALAPVVRYRDSGDDDRARLRWVLLAALTVPLTLLLCWASLLFRGDVELVPLGLVAMFLSLPVATVTAVLGPAVVDVDRLVVTVTSSAVLASGVLMILTVAGAAAGAPVSAWPIPTSATAVTVLCAAAVACSALARRWCEAVLSPERARALTAIRELAMRVDRGTGVPEELQRVLRRVLRDEDLVVAYRRIGDDDLVAFPGGEIREGARSRPARARGEEVGAVLTSAARARPVPLAVVQASTPLIDAVRTRAALVRATSDVEASRRRMLRAGDEERRRVERDLHDGAQQRLVALGMRLRVLQRTTSTGDAVAAQLDDAVAELAAAVAELRRLAQGVRPSALDDGLGPALAALSRQSATPVVVDVDADGIADPAATTAYFVASEAVANALKHAAATRVRVTVRVADACVRLRVEDDGRGGARFTTNGGLTGLSDRVAALGGRLSVASPPGGGTVVEAVVPCAS